MTLTIEAGRTERHYWRDLWRYRELFWFLAWRDFLVRYKQTALGLAWTLLRPILAIAVFTLVFGRLAGLPSGGAPYPLLVLSAMLAWQFFATGFGEAGLSLVNNASLVAKVYFPRLVIPASAVLVSVVDFLVSFVLLVLAMLWYGQGWSPQLLLLPLFLLMAFATALGAGLWVAALNVKYRDFRFIVPFVLQMGLYVSPVGFSSALVPEQWRLLYALNPMAGVIDGFRWCILGDAYPVHWPAFAVSLATTVLVFAGGLAFFRRTERQFADVI